MDGGSLVKLKISKLKSLGMIFFVEGVELPETSLGKKVPYKNSLNPINSLEVAYKAQNYADER